jgi:flagellar hook protein FlgE
MSVRSLGAATSGIDTMQTDLDTIGNDIANSETDGFKSGTAEFEDLLTEQLQPAGAASGTSLASTNPSAVGAGAEVSAIATDFSEGPVTQTGVSSDVAIEGNGFLVVSQNGQTSYTRDGDLQIDSNGNLATEGGGLVLGWAEGQPTTSPPGPLSIIVGSAEPPAETQNIDLGGNLPAGSTTPVNVTTTMYDALGNAVPVDLTFTPTGAANTWTMQGTVPGAATTLWAAPQTVVFGANGQLASINGAAVGTGTTSLAIGTPPSNYTWTGAAPEIDFPAAGSENAVTQFAADQTIAVTSQDGYAAGTLDSYSIGANGAITGTYSNGESQTLGTIALAQFANPQGLDDVGNGEYTPTAASGSAQLGEPGTNGLGSLQGGAVEGSNVDLATELTDLIEAQTAYQANTKVVDSTSTALQSLVEMS